MVGVVVIDVCNQSLNVFRCVDLLDVQLFGNVLPSVVFVVVLVVNLPFDGIIARPWRAGNFRSSLCTVVCFDAGLQLVQLLAVQDRWFGEIFVALRVAALWLLTGLDPIVIGPRWFSEIFIAVRIVACLLLTDRDGPLAGL